MKNRKKKWLEPQAKRLKRKTDDIKYTYNPMTSPYMRIKIPLSRIRLNILKSILIKNDSVRELQGGRF